METVPGSPEEATQSADRAISLIEILKVKPIAELKVALMMELRKPKVDQIFVLSEEINSRSDCWKSFSHIYEKKRGILFHAHGTGYVSCRSCCSVYAFRPSNGTSTLHRHSTQCKSQHANKQHGAMMNYLAKRVPASDEKKKIARAAALMCCQDLRPFSIFSGKGFENFAAQLIQTGARHGGRVDAKDLLPCGNTVSQYTQELATTVRAQITELCRKHFDEGLHAGFTTDLWTDSVKKRSYMAVTIHLIDKDFRLHARTLQAREMESESHTATEVLKAFEVALQRFGVNDKALCTTVSDSGSNMSARSSIRSVYKWIPCADHKIATILTTAFNKTTVQDSGVRSNPFYRFEDDAKEIFDLIDNCKSLVRYVKQANLQHLLPTTLKQENVTRWNSLLKLLDSVQRNYDHVTTLLSQRNQLRYMAYIDRELLSEVIRFLRRFEEATLKLESWKKPTLHFVLYERYCISQELQVRRESYETEEEGVTTVIKPDSRMMLKLKEAMQSYWSRKWQVNSVHLMAALLDPRQKNRLSKFGASNDEIIAGKRGIKDMMDQIKSGASVQTFRSAMSSKRAAKRCKSTSNAIDLWSSDEDSEGTEITEMNADTNELELQRYWALKLSKEYKDKEEFNLLSWWKQNSEATAIDRGLPILAKVARCILCIPASSAMSESVFSDAGTTVSKKRNSIDPDRVDDIMVVRSSADLLMCNTNIRLS